MPCSLYFYRTKTDPRQDLQEDLSGFIVAACLTLSVVHVATYVYGTLRRVRAVRVLYGSSSSTRL